MSRGSCNDPQEPQVTCHCAYIPNYKFSSFLPILNVLDILHILHIGVSVDWNFSGGCRAEWQSFHRVITTQKPRLCYFCVTGVCLIRCALPVPPGSSEEKYNFIFEGISSYPSSLREKSKKKRFLKIVRCLVYFTVRRSKKPPLNKISSKLNFSFPGTIKNNLKKFEINLRVIFGDFLEIFRS